MRVLVDARSAVAPHPTGIGLYARELLRRLPRLDPHTEYTAWYLNAKGWAGGPRHLLADLAAPNLRERETHVPARWFARVEARFDAPRIEWLTRFDVLFAPNFLPPPTRSRRLVVTVHDLAFKRFPETAPHGTRWWLERLAATVERPGVQVIVPSEATRTDLLDLYRVEPDRVTVIPHGVDREVFRPSTPEEIESVRRRFAIEGPYLLALGGIEPRKNLPRAVEAWASLKGDVRPMLVVAGGSVEWNPEGRQRLEGALSALPDAMRSRVVVTGYVTEPEKVALLGGAEALVYPSLYEGFGLPVLEAMACGTPVVTSNRSALPEVVGDAAVLVDPDTVEAIREGLDKVLGDGALRQTLFRKGIDRAAEFSWDHTASSTAAVLRGFRRG